MWGLSDGSEMKGKLWSLGKDVIKEVDEYKYLGVWTNRQTTGYNHVNHLVGKAVGLQNWQGWQSSGERKRI